jgi:C-terminal processing protease CtpA/Prc
MPQEVHLNDTALPSSAESFAGPMLANDRAILVGDRTAGMCGVLRSLNLAAGWTICLATHRTDLGS